VASNGARPFQLMRIWVVAWLHLFTIRLSKITCGVIMGAEGVVGNVDCNALFLMCFFNWDTWKTRWMEAIGGNNSL